MMRISIAAGVAAAWLVSQPTGQQWDARSIDPTMIAAVEAQRAASFALERNAEIDASIAAVEAQRQALVRAGAGSVATSAGASTRTYGGETWRPRPIQSRKSGSGTL